MGVLFVCELGSGAFCDLACFESKKEGNRMKVYVDGNPKEVCCVAVSDEGMVGGAERAPIDGTNTNNVAEYRAILFGLYKHPEATEVVSDSQLVIKQLRAECAVKSQGLLP